MAWIYLAAADSPQKVWHHGCAQSPIVKSTDISKTSFSAECSEEKSKAPQFGMTLSLFEDVSSQELILSQEDSHARTSVLRVLASAWVQSERVCSIIWSGLSKKHRRLLCSSKTSQGLGDIFQWSEIRLKYLVMSAEMVFSQPQMLELITNERDGSCWPTLTAKQYGFNQGGQNGRRGKKRYSLWALWRIGKLPTLCAREWRPAGLKSELNRNSPSVWAYWKATTGTNMPVSFCEWIWGVPIGATRLEPLVTQYRRSKKEKHSEDCVV